MNLKFSDHIIEAYDRPFKWYTTPIVDLGTYEFKNLSKGKITPEEFLLTFMLKKYMSRDMSVPPIKYCVQYYMPNMKSRIYIRLRKINVNILQ